MISFESASFVIANTACGAANPSLVNAAPAAGNAAAAITPSAITVALAFMPYLSQSMDRSTTAIAPALALVTGSVQVRRLRNKLQTEPVWFAWPELSTGNRSAQRSNDREPTIEECAESREFFR